MQQIRNVQIIEAGQRWNGSWQVDADLLVVSSAYGSKTAKASKDHEANKALAEKLMRQLAKAR